MNWNQLQTILWLRWRLTRNQWGRSGNLGAVIAVALAIAGIAVSFLLFVAGVTAGIFAFRDAPAITVLVTWDIITGLFCIVWLVGLLTELQRSESIDLQRLMHLPVALGQIFTINYVASHFVLSIVLAVPAMVGLAIGLAIGRTPAMLLLIPLSLTMIFMISAWTYCLRGWLAALMANPRRRRSALVMITMAVVLICQLPNIYFNVLSRNWAAPPLSGSREQHQQRMNARRARQEASFQTFLNAQKFVPPFWLPLAAHSIYEGRLWPALAATAGCAVIGAAGLRRAYRGTVRFYRGGETRKGTPGATRSRTRPTAARAGSRRMLVERRLPFVSDETSAVAMGTFVSMLRAPEVKMQWAMAIMMTVIFTGMTGMRAGQGMPPPFKPLVVTGLTTMMLFMMVQAMANQFGFDRGGFRAIVLAPISRRHVLLGKNLANVPIVWMLALAVVTITSVWLQVPLLAAITILLQFVAMFLLVCMVGNFLSALVPYRIRHGSLKPTKMPAKAQLMMFLTHMLFPLVMAPGFVPTIAQILWEHAGWPAVPIGLILAALLALGAAIGYWLSLEPAARLLQRREMKMLDLLSTEVE